MVSGYVAGARAGREDALELCLAASGLVQAIIDVFEVPDRCAELLLSQSGVAFMRNRAGTLTLGTELQDGLDPSAPFFLKTGQFRATPAGIRLISGRC